METNYVMLRTIQVIHLVIDLFCMSYLFFFNTVFDIYYCGFILLQTAHWMCLKNECILSYIEKKIIHPPYQLGDNPKWIPHYKLFFNSYTKMLKAFLIVGSLLYIAFRNKNRRVKILCIASIVLWIYLTYFHANSRL
jgi:hypothetical protein